MESLFDVVVRNELTGEVVSVRVPCNAPQDAQIEALLGVFKNRGWRKALALPAEPVNGVSERESA